MKKILFIALLVMAFRTYSQNPIYTQLSQINLSNYVSKPVDSIIALLPSGYSSSGFVGNLTSNKVRFYFVRYSEGTVLYIYVKNYQYMNPIDPNRIWNFEQYRHEPIWYLWLWNIDNPSLTSTD